MDDNKEKFTKFVEQFKNSICLGHSSKPVRLLNFGEDEDDYYYIVQRENGEVSWSSCAVPLIGLLGKLDNEDYNEIEYSFRCRETENRNYDYPDRKDYTEDLLKR